MSELSKLTSEQADSESIEEWEWSRINFWKLLSVCTEAVYNVKIPNLFGMGRE